MKVKYGPEFEKSLKRVLWFERTRHFNPKEYYRQIKWFIQRGRRGYSDQDLWGAYHHIASTVDAFVDYNLRYGHGYPVNLTNKSWNKILKEIQWYMREVSETTDTPYEVYSTEKYKQRCEKANALFAQYWQHLWD